MHYNKPSLSHFTALQDWVGAYEESWVGPMKLGGGYEESWVGGLRRKLGRGLQRKLGGGP